MRYFYITVETGYCGEWDSEYVARETEKEAEEFAIEFADSNAMENIGDHEDEDDFDEEEFMASSDYTIEEITEQEFIERGGNLNI